MSFKEEIEEMENCLETEKLNEKIQDETKWCLNWGIYGKKAGRLGRSQFLFFDSIEGCKYRLGILEKSYNIIDHKIWYATAYGPRGEKVKLHKGIEVTPFLMRYSKDC